jgi:hypothetical protein
MRKFVIGLTILFQAVSVSAGYGNTSWGMTPNEVIEAENGRAKIIEPIRYKSNFGKVRIDNIKIGIDEFTVTFLFDSNDQLVQTNLIKDNKNNPSSSKLTFDSLHRLLTQKYGEAKFKGNNSVTWKTNDTTIELSLIIIPGVISQTSVRYVPNSKNDADTANL